MSIKKIKTTNQKRYFEIESTEQTESNLIKIAFSSEEPYLRQSEEIGPFYEVIDHKSMDISKLNNKAAVLFNHDYDQLIGVVESAWIENARGYALIRISSTAEKYKIMIDEKVLTKVSFGYEYVQMFQTGFIDEIPVVACKVKPFELTLCSVPADDSIGIFRNKDSEQEKEIEVELTEEENKKSVDEVMEETEEEKQKKELEIQKLEDEKNKKTEDPIIEEDKNKKAVEEEVLSQEEIVDKEKDEQNQQLIDNEKKFKDNTNINIITKRKNMDEIKEILALAKRTGKFELATEFISAGKSLVQFQDALIDLGTTQASNLDAGAKKELAKFDFVEFINEKIAGKEGKFTAMAKELSQDFAGRKSNGTDSVFIPRALFQAKRDYSMVNHGANFSSQDFRNQMIEQLWNNSVVLPLINKLPNATGFNSVKLPKALGKNTFQFLAENERANESNINDGSLVFTPKTIGGRTVISRDLLKQSILSQAIIIDQLLKSKDEFVDEALLNGTGGAGWTGLFNVVGAGAVAFGTNGGQISYDKVVEFESQINFANANTGALNYITNSKVIGKMKTTQQFANYGAAILNGGQANGYNVAISNQVKSDGTKGTGSNLSSMALINGSMIKYLEWDGYELVVNPYRLGAGQVEIELFLSADMQVDHASAIVVAKDIIA